MKIQRHTLLLTAGFIAMATALPTAANAQTRGDRYVGRRFDLGTAIL